MITIHQRYRRTDGQTTCDRNTALCTKVHRAVKTYLIDQYIKRRVFSQGCAFWDLDNDGPSLGGQNGPQILGHKYALRPKNAFIRGICLPIK